MKEQLATINIILNKSYTALLRSLGPAGRKSVAAAERRWIVQRNNDCNVQDGITYVMLGPFGCHLNMTSDRLRWIASRRATADTTKNIPR